MKTNTINYIKTIISDRVLAALIIAFVLGCLAYCVFIGISLRPSDLQVAVHYTAFGEAGFYREKWYYFINFIVLGLLMMVMHTILTVKLYIQGRRQMALFFISLSILLVVIAWFLTRAILRVAFL